MTARPEGDFDDVIAFAWDGPAGSVADAARLLLLDSLGCMIAGLGHATPRRFADALAITMPGAVHLPGCAAGLSEAGAAAVLAPRRSFDLVALSSRSLTAAVPREHEPITVTCDGRAAARAPPLSQPPSHERTAPPSHAGTPQDSEGRHHSGLTMPVEDHEEAVRRPSSQMHLRLSPEPLAPPQERPSYEHRTPSLHMLRGQEGEREYGWSSSSAPAPDGVCGDEDDFDLSLGALLPLPALRLQPGSTFAKAGCATSSVLRPSRLPTATQQRQLESLGMDPSPMLRAPVQRALLPAPLSCAFPPRKLLLSSSGA